MCLPYKFHLPSPSPLQHNLTPAHLLLGAESVTTAAPVSNRRPQQLIHTNIPLHSPEGWGKGREAFLEV